VVLTRARGAAAEEAEAASGGGASGAGGAGQVRREAVRVLARMVAGVARPRRERDASFQHLPPVQAGSTANHKQAQISTMNSLPNCPQPVSLETFSHGP